MDDFIGIAFAVAVSTLIVVSFIIEVVQLNRARRAWDEARALGIEFVGEFPELSMERGPVSFASRTVAGAKGARIYVQSYVAQGFRPSSTPSSALLLSEVQRAEGLGLQFEWSAHEVTATCHGIPFPDDVLDRIDAFAAVVRACGIRPSTRE